MTLYVQAHVNLRPSERGQAGLLHVVDLMDEEGDDLTPHLEGETQFATVGELKEVLRRRFNTDIEIEVIDTGPKLVAPSA